MATEHNDIETAGFQLLLLSSNDAAHKAALAHYITLGKALYHSQEYEALRDTIEGIQDSQEEKEEKQPPVPPFILSNDSSGIGKTQAFFGLDFKDELYFVLSEPSKHETQAIYHSFWSVSQIMLECLARDFRRFRRANRLTGWTAATILGATSFSFGLLGLFHWLLTQPFFTLGDGGEEEHPLVRQARLSKVVDIEGMTTREFAMAHPKFVGMFDEIPSLDAHCTKKLTQERVQFLRNVVRAARGVCIFSGADCTTIGDSIRWGAGRGENGAALHWAVIWLRFPYATRETLKLKYDLSLLSPSWSHFLDLMLEVKEGRGNRPWFVELLVRCLTTKQEFRKDFPDFCERGLRVVAHLAFEHILDAKQSKTYFRSSQMKLLYAAYSTTKNRSGELVSSHFALAVTHDTNHPDAVNLFTGQRVLQQRFEPLGDVSLEESVEENMPRYYSFPKSEVVLQDGRRFMPCAVFPLANQEPLLHLFCADEPLVCIEEGQKVIYTLHAASINPLNPGCGIPMQRINILDNICGPTADSVEGMAAAAMCIASHRTRGAFACPPFIFLREMVIEQLGLQSIPFDCPPFFQKFIGSLSVPYAMPPNFSAVSFCGLTMGQLTRVGDEGFGIELTHPDSSRFLHVSAECRHAGVPSLHKLLRHVPKDVVGERKWLRIIVCQELPELPTTSFDISSLIIAALKPIPDSKPARAEFTRLEVLVSDEPANDPEDDDDSESSEDETSNNVGEKDADERDEKEDSSEDDEGDVKEQANKKPKRSGQEKKEETTDQMAPLEVVEKENLQEDQQTHVIQVGQQTSQVEQQQQATLQKVIVEVSAVKDCAQGVAVGQAQVAAIPQEVLSPQEVPQETVTVAPHAGGSSSSSHEAVSPARVAASPSREEAVSAPPLPSLFPPLPLGGVSPQAEAGLAKGMIVFMPLKELRTSPWPF